MLSPDQKQQLENKLAQLQNSIQLDGNTVIINNRRFNFPTEGNRVLSNTKKLSR